MAEEQTPAETASPPRETALPPTLRYVLLGDCDSPQLLKWARALARMPGLQLWAASSRRFANGFDAVVPRSRQLALGLKHPSSQIPLGLLKASPKLLWWLRRADPHWVHAHGLTSFGVVSWLAVRHFGVRARLVGSGSGNDILVTMGRQRWRSALMRRVLRECSMTTAGSPDIAERMRELGAPEVMAFPVGLEALPAPSGEKAPWMCFTNRRLEPLNHPERVLEQFAALAAQEAEARLVVAHEGSMRGELERRARAQELRGRVTFTGRLDAAAQAASYARAQWFFSLPEADALPASLIEAMAHGCIPVVSDLPAYRAAVRDGDNGIVLAQGETLTRERLEALRMRAAEISEANRAWIQRHALFTPAVLAFVRRLRQIDGSAAEAAAPAAPPSGAA